MNETAIQLDGPFPLSDPNHAVFRARNRRDDVFVHLITNPHYFYPHFFTFRGQPGPDTLVNLSEAAAFHSVLEHLHNRPKDKAGWWTENLRTTCRGLGMDADTLAPKFPADADACGRDLVMLQNTHFERTYGSGISNSDQARSISSAMFVASVIKSLQTGKGVETTDAREWFDYARRWFGDIHETQVPFLREVGMTLVRHGFWIPGDTSGALGYRA